MSIRRHASVLSRSVLPILFALITPAHARPARAAPVSEIVVDAQGGRVLYSTFAELARPPASLTKMMTLLLAFEAIKAGKLRLDGELVMTRRGARQPPSKLGLTQGRTMSLSAAMRAIAVISANDVAVALAERVSGNEALFVETMNRRAKQLGMANTRFDNPTGLAPSTSVTTAHDVATLARYIISHYPDRYRMFSARFIRWDGSVRPNHNRLLGKVRGVDGVKTGYTVPAGFNLAASSLRGGKRVVVVVLGARTGAARDLLVANLLESGFSSPVVHRPAARDASGDEGTARAAARRRRMSKRGEHEWTGERRDRAERARRA